MEIKFEVITPKKGTLERQIWDAVRKGLEKNLLYRTFDKIGVG